MTLQEDFQQRLNEAEETGTPVCCYQVGRYYESGLGTPVDKQKANFWYKKAFENNGLNIVLALAEAKDAEAAFIMGRIYDKGQGGLSIDYSQAFHFYTIAASQEYAPAQYNLGVMYARGRGVVKDEVEAVEWYRQAAEQGYAPAQLKLGWIYSAGRGVAKNALKALHWYRQAAAHEHATAQTNTGVVYAIGHEAAKDKIALESTGPVFKAYRFQQLIAQQAKQQREQRSYQEHDLELQSRILSLSEKDELDALLENQPSYSLIEITEVLPLLIEWAKHARALIQRRSYVYPVTVQAIQAYQSQSRLNRYFNPSPLTPSALFQQQQMFFWESIIPKQRKQLQRLLKLKPLSVEQSQFLSALLSYVDRLTSLCQKRVPASILIHESTQGTRLLAPEFAAKLLPEDELVSDVGQDSPRVVIVNGVHYMCATTGMITIAPGIEYMVDLLNELLIGHGSAPSTLLKVTQGSRQIIYQASKTVTGSDLQYILEQEPKYLDDLDKDNFSAMAILGILTNPQDGKADNYRVEIEADYDEANKERIKALHIVGIDNGMAFGKSEELDCCSDEEECFSSEVRNVLFLFPQMNQPLSDEFRAQFLDRSPELLMIEWLAALSERNKGYERLLKHGVFTQADFSGEDNTNKGLQLPILLAFGLARTIYRKLVKLQAYLRQNPLATHHQLLTHVEPVIAVLYERTRTQYSDITAGLHHIYSTSLGDSLKSQLNNQASDFHTVASRLIYESTLAQARESTIAQAVEELILEINWPAVSEEMEKEILVNALNKASLQSPTQLLHQLVGKQNITPQLIAFLLHRKASLKGFAELRGYHILHTAVRSASIEIIQLFLQAGAEVNAKDDAGETPLDKLIKEASPQLAIIQFLMANNAKTSSSHYEQILSELLSGQNIVVIDEGESLSSSNEKSQVPPERLQFLGHPQAMNSALSSCNSSPLPELVIARSEATRQSRSDF